MTYIYIYIYTGLLKLNFPDARELWSDCYLSKRKEIWTRGTTKDVLGIYVKKRFSRKSHIAMALKLYKSWEQHYECSICPPQLSTTFPIRRTMFHRWTQYVRISRENKATNAGLTQMYIFHDRPAPSRNPITRNHMRWDLVSKEAKLLGNKADHSVI